MKTNVWPWWIFSDTEAHHWSAKIAHRDVHGGQCNGLFWRHSRNEWLESGRPNAHEELVEYDWPWVQAHGEQAMQDAIRDTEAAFQASLKRGDTLKSLTDAAERKTAEIAASKEEARRGSGKGKGRGGHQQARGATADSEPKRQRIGGVSWKSGSQWRASW